MLQVSQDVRAVPLGADGPVPALPTERGGLQLRLGTWRAGVGSGEGLKSIRKIKGINKAAIKVFSTPILKYQNFKTSLLFFKVPDTLAENIILRKLLSTNVFFNGTHWPKHIHRNYWSKI